MKIILHGFGAMGKMVLEESQNRSEFEVVGIIDSHYSNPSSHIPIFSSFDNLPLADLVIDFSHPSRLTNLLAFAKTSHIKLVLATTGYSESDLQQIHEAAKEIAIFQSYNMSLGIRMLLDALQILIPQAKGLYDIEIEERHHRKKIDAPSGTAWLLFRSIAKLIPGVEAILDRSKIKEARQENEIGITALRGGTIFGEHTILFAGQDELIEIKHTALSKRIFATGALSAAQFLQNKETGFYNLENLNENNKGE